MSEDGRWIPPLRAGRRPAGAALLGWLSDDRSPRLCRVAGSAGVGKTHLLDWLALGCTTERTPSSHRVDAALSAAGLSVRAALWSLGHQLGVVARTPEELLTALAEHEHRTVVCVSGTDRAADPAKLVEALLEPLLRLPQVRLIVEAPDGSPAALGLTSVPEPAVLDLDLPQWTDQERFAAWCASESADAAAYPNPGAALGLPGKPTPASLMELVVQLPMAADGTPDVAGAGEQLLTDFWEAAVREGATEHLLGDPLLLSHAAPAVVTSALEGATGVVAEAWDSIGPAVIAEADRGVRAAVLRTRLLGLDDVFAERLAGAGAPWQAAWALWPNSSVGWPGPVASLAAGSGSYAGQVLLADPGGTIRTVDAVTGTPQARITTPGPKPLRSLSVTPGGTVLLLDSWGGLDVVQPPEPGEGLAADALEAPLDALRDAATAQLSVLHAVPGLPGAVPALADESGAVHWYQDGAVITRRLHQGPVTALAGAAPGGVPVLVSGGFDGAVRLWTPGAEAPEPLDQRSCLVGAVAAADTPGGLVVAAAWSDGVVRVRRPARPEAPLELRLGSPVWALALVAGRVLLGTSDGVAAIAL